VVSFPLLARNGVTRLGALDLYLVMPEPVPAFFLSVVADAIAAPISTVLFDAEPGVAGRNVLPPWLSNAAVKRRMQVWVAVGILIEHAGTSNDDALAALRAYAFGHDETIEDTAAGLLSQALHPQAVITHPAGPRLSFTREPCPSRWTSPTTPTRPSPPLRRSEPPSARGSPSRRRRVC